MDIIEKEQVKVENALIVKGLTLTETDSELETFLQKYGAVKRNLIIDDPTSDFHHNVILEFAHSSAMLNLTPLLPLTLGSLLNPNVIFQVRALASVHNQTTSGAVTEEYVGMLKALARESGRPFSDVLQEELEKLQETQFASGPPAVAQSLCSDGSQGAEAIVPAPVSYSPGPLLNRDEIVGIQTPESKDPTKRLMVSVTSPDLERNIDGVTVTTSPAFPVNVVEPPGVQRMVVEHIVKTSEHATSQQALVCLRAFSGRSPHPLLEPNFVI